MKWLLNFFRRKILYRQKEKFTVNYVGHELGSKGINETVRLAKPVKEATLSYEVKFHNDFQFRKGGKLFRLGSKWPTTGGGQQKPERWSVAVMFKPKGKTGLYIYDQNRNKKFGTTYLSKEIVFTKGQWHKLDLYIKINDKRFKNGIVELYVDGKEQIKLDNIEFHDSHLEDVNIWTFLKQTFHGGRAKGYAPRDKNGNPITVHASFKNIKVTK